MTTPTTLRQKAIDMRCDSMCCRGKVGRHGCAAALPPSGLSRFASQAKPAAADAVTLAVLSLFFAFQFIFTGA